MNITLTGKKITQDERILAFKKDNLTAQMTFTVDTDDSWVYKLDVRLPEKCCTGEELFNIIDLPMDANRTCTIDVTAAMVPLTGKYTMQLRGISGEQVYHSDTFEVWVKYSIDPGMAYDPVPSEFYQIEQNVTEMNNHPPKPGQNGYWLIWDITTSQYEESAIPLPDGMLPDMTADTSGKYLSNDGKKAYWTEVQTGEENKIDKIEVNGVEQPIVDKTVNIAVPTKTSDLSNDSGYITNEALDGYATKAELPTKVSQLENDSKFINESALDGYAKTADIPIKTSQLNNDSGYITANDIPVKSVDGATGDVVTNAVKTTEQILTDAQKQQARENIGAGTSSFDGDYNSLTNKPTIPTKTSELSNDSGFITDANIPVKSVNGKTGDVTLDAKSVGALPDTTVVPSKTSELDNDSGFITDAALTGYAKTTDIPTKTSQLDNDSNYITANEAPVTSVNNKTGAVTLSATDVSAIPSTLTGTAGQVLTKTADGQEWKDVDIPTALPNPNALTFTGAVNATYDGSTPLSVNIPSGGSGGTDISLGLTSAAVGQTIKVKAVDESGKPTSWEAVDMPSGGGGGGETWELINEITIPDDAEETNALIINEDLNGNPFELKKALLFVYMPKYTGGSTIPSYAFSSLNGIFIGGSAPATYTRFIFPNKSQNRSMWWRVSVANNGLPYREELAKTNVSGNKRNIGGNGNIALFDEYILDGTEPAKESITEIGTKDNLIYAGCYFALYGVRK